MILYLQILLKIVITCGTAVWLRLRYGINGKHHAILISDDNAEVNEYALKHIKEYIKFQHTGKVTVFTYRDDVFEKAQKTESVAKSVLITEKIFFRIASCCRLKIKYVKIISLSYPENVQLANFIGIRDFTVEDLVCYCCYGMFSYESNE